jgi:hypothetical protein
MNNEKRDTQMNNMNEKMHHFGYKNLSNIDEGAKAEVVFPSSRRNVQPGDLLVNVANGDGCVVGIVVEYERPLSNFATKRIFISDSDNRKPSKYDGLLGKTIKRFVIPNMTLGLLQGGMVRLTDQAKIESYI